MVRDKCSITVKESAVPEGQEKQKFWGGWCGKQWLEHRESSWMDRAAQ